MRFTILISLLLAGFTLSSCRDKKDDPPAPPDWSRLPVVMPNTYASSQSPCIAVDSRNVVHIAWREFNWLPPDDIYYASSDKSGIVQNISNSGSALYPNITIGPDDVVHIAWQEMTDGVYQVYIANSTDWIGSRVKISNSIDGAGRPLLAVDCNNIVHAVWGEIVTDGYVIIETPLVYANSTDWAGPRIIIPNSQRVGVIHAMAVDSSGVAHVAWSQDEFPDANIWYANSTDWTASQVNVSNMADESLYPCMAIDSRDIVHIVWTHDPAAGLNQTYYANSTDWSATKATIPISWPIVTITIDKEDVIHAVWDQSIEIYYANSTDWFAEQTNISNTNTRPFWNSLYPDIAVDSDGVVHVVWEEFYDSGNCEVWYTRLVR